MKFKFTLLINLVIPIALFAQNNLSYDQKAAEIKKNIWEKQNTIFDSNVVPEQYNKESAVVLARNFEMQRTSGGKFKFMIVTATSITQTNKTTTWREKVKINDKTALEKFSTLEYDKIIDKTASFLIMSVKNKKEVFIGIKIIKPSGKEIIVNTNEEVILASNKSKDKAGKLAVPELQVGDIIDYYISTIQVKDGQQEDDEHRYTFLLADEYPVLNYSYKFQYGKKINVFYLSANGAPKASVSTNADNDQIITYSGKNILKYKNELWSSPYRDLPYFCISSNFQTKYDQMMMADPLAKLDKIDPKVSRLDNYISNFQALFNTRYITTNDFIYDQTKKHFKSSKALKNAPLDSSMKVLYNNWKFLTFCYYNTDDFDMSNKNFRFALTKINTQNVCKTLCDMEIPHDILITNSRFGNSLDNVFEDGDFQTFIRVNGPKPIFLSFDKVNTAFNEIPIDFQGEKAIVLTPRRKGDYNFVFTKSETVIPVTTAEQNSLTERLNVNFSKDNMQKIIINRNVKEIGFMRLSDQLHLCYVEDIDKELTAVTHNDELKKRYNDKKIVNNLQTAFDMGRKDIKKNFINEITEQFDQEPKEVTSFKVVKSGILTSELEHESSFTFENFVKKAGSNYILDIGRLIGKISKVGTEEKTRQTNIYMPGARSLNYNINVDIPTGYNVSGVNDLNYTKTNNFGSFSVISKVLGQKLVVDVKRVYTKAFVDKKDWNELTYLIDAAGNFYEQKVLFERTN